MAVSDWSTDPSANTSIEGINAAEGMPAANVNNLFRAMAAAIKRDIFNILPNLANYILRDGSQPTTGDLKRQSRGAYLHHASSAMQSGRVYVQAQGSPVPSGMQDGDILIEY